MRTAVAALVILLSGCPGDPRLFVEAPDADVFAMHAPDGSDAADAADVTDAAPEAAPDVVVDTAVADSGDVADAVDAPDGADAADTADAPDGAGAYDAPDAPGAVDVTDAPTVDTTPAGSATYQFCGDGGHCIGADRCLGPSSARVPYCAHTCTLNSDCPLAPAGSMTTAYCGSTSTGSWCELLCTAGVSTCPTGLECLAGTCQ